METIGSRTRALRVPHGGSVLFELAERGNEDGLVVNLSETGVFLTSRVTMDMGSRVILFLPLSLKKKRSLCVISGSVVRIHDKGRKARQRGYGVKFDALLPPASRSMLRDFVSYRSGEASR